MKTLYLSPTLRRQSILSEAIKLAEEHGFHKITRAAVAQRLGCTAGLVNRYFHPVSKLRDAVMEMAVAEGKLPIVAAGLVLRHPAALRAPLSLRTRAALSLQS